MQSTLIHRMLEREEAAKPTLALEYTFGRKSNLNLSKVMLVTNFMSHVSGHNRYLKLRQDVCHIWELGGGTLFTKLLETPMSPSKLETLK